MNTSLHGSSTYTVVGSDDKDLITKVDVIHSFLCALVGALDPASQVTLARGKHGEEVLKLTITIEPLYWNTFIDDGTGFEKCL